MTSPPSPVRPELPAISLAPTHQHGRENCEGRHREADDNEPHPYPGDDRDADPQQDDDPKQDESSTPCASKWGVRRAVAHLSSRLLGRTAAGTCERLGTG